ncbi:TonB-dependent receptor [Pseudomonas sp. Marseille-QA0892]
MPTSFASRKKGTRPVLLPLYLAISFASMNGWAQSNEIDLTPENSSPTETPGGHAGVLQLGETAINASADASAEGLTPEYQGGQVARGGRIGIFGNQDYMETPFTSTAYTNQLIRDQQARSVSDIVQNDPSVRVSRGFGNMQELYMVRGFRLFSDDISYNGLYGLLPRQYVASEFIERAEVFRGASAFLNGAAPGGSGIGGMINLVPKRAPDEPLTRLTLGAESGGQGLAGADIARRFGEENRFGVRLNAAKHQGDTSVDDEKRTLDMFALGLDYQGDNFRVSADIGHQYHFVDAPRPSVTPGVGIALPSAPDAKDNFAQPWTFSKEKQTFGTLRGEYDFTESVTGWVAGGVRHGEEENRLANPTYTGGDATTAYRFDNRRKEEVSTGEIGLRGYTLTGPVSHQWVMSAATFRAEERNAFGGNYGTFVGALGNAFDVPMPTLDPSTVSSPFSDPRVIGRTRTQSLAIADTLGFLEDRLLITVGARRQGIHTTDYDGFTGVAGPDGDLKRYKTTPVGGVLYKLTDEVSVYANYIEGLARGDSAPFTSNVGPVQNPGQRLQPHVAKQTEVGVKYDRGNMGASVAVFRTERRFGVVGNDLVFREGGDQINRGVEVSVFGEPTMGVRLLGGVTLLDTDLRNTDGGEFDGNHAIGVPRVQANIGGEWDVPGLNGVTLTSRVVHTGRQYTDLDNSRELPSWTRVDLGARYTLKVEERDVTLRANLNNVTGRDYWASTGGYANNNYLVLGEPRTLTVSASVDF